MVPHALVSLLEPQAELLTASFSGPTCLPALPAPAPSSLTQPQLVRLWRNGPRRMGASRQSLCKCEFGVRCAVSTKLNSTNVQFKRCLDALPESRRFPRRTMARNHSISGYRCELGQRCTNGGILLYLVNPSISALLHSHLHLSMHQ